MEEQRGDPSHQEEEEEDSEGSDNPEAEIWYYKGKQVSGKPAAQNSKAWRQPLAQGASSSVDHECEKNTGSDMGPLPSNIAGHIAPHGSRLLHGQENLWKTTMRFHGRFECEFGYSENVHEYHSSSSSSSRKRL